MVETHVDQPLSDGRLLWPDAAVNDEGRGIAWPGWEQRNGRWFEIPSNVRPRMTVEFNVNPSVTAEFSYPPATPACATAPRNVVVGIPMTPGGLALLASLLALVGVGALRTGARS